MGRRLGWRRGSFRMMWGSGAILSRVWGRGTHFRGLIPSLLHHLCRLASLSPRMASKTLRSLGHLRIQIALIAGNLDKCATSILLNPPLPTPTPTGLRPSHQSPSPTPTLLSPPPPPYPPSAPVKPPTQSGAEPPSSNAWSKNSPKTGYPTGTAMHPPPPLPPSGTASPSSA